MTREALRDAFTAGWILAAKEYNRQPGQLEISIAFETWYRHSCATGNRALDWATADFAEIERRIIGNTELLAEGLRDALGQNIVPDMEGIRTGRFSSTTPNFTEDATERDRQINQALGYPMYQAGMPLAPKTPAKIDRAGKTKEHKVKGRKR